MAGLPAFENVVLKKGADQVRARKHLIFLGPCIAVLKI